MTITTNNVYYPTINQSKALNRNLIYSYWNLMIVNHSAHTTSISNKVIIITTYSVIETLAICQSKYNSGRDRKNSYPLALLPVWHLWSTQHPQVNMDYGCGEFGSTVY